MSATASFRHLPLLLAAATGLLAAAPAALAQKQTQQSGIYTCIDSQGRRLTSDRPIMSCLDREQRELNSSGTVRRVVPPVMTAAERDAQEARRRQEQEQIQRERNQTRRDNALLIRYPTRAAHEEGRRAALEQTQVVVQTAQRNLELLAEERKQLEQEMEFYAKDPAKAPGKLRRALELSDESVKQQQRTIAGQKAERDRINAQFDDEARRLTPGWQAAATRR